MGWIKPLRSHYPVFLGVWLPFLPKNFGKCHNFLISFIVGIISWKCGACSWWVEIYPEIRLIYLVLWPNSTKFRRADRMDFIPLANPNMFGGSNLLRKMGWNYPSGALCLQESGTSWVFIKFPWVIEKYYRHFLLKYFVFYKVCILYRLCISFNYLQTMIFYDQKSTKKLSL